MEFVRSALLGGAGLGLQVGSGSCDGVEQQAGVSVREAVHQVAQDLARVRAQNLKLQQVWNMQSF